MCIFSPRGKSSLGASLKERKISCAHGMEMPVAEQRALCPSALLCVLSLTVIWYRIPKESLFLLPQTSKLFKKFGLDCFLCLWTTYAEERFWSFWSRVWKSIENEDPVEWKCTRMIAPAWWWELEGSWLLSEEPALRGTSLTPNFWWGSHTIPPISWLITGILAVKCFRGSTSTNLTCKLRWDCINSTWLRA